MFAAVGLTGREACGMVIVRSQTEQKEAAMRKIITKPGPWGSLVTELEEDLL